MYFPIDSVKQVTKRNTLVSEIETNNSEAAKQTGRGEISAKVKDAIKNRVKTNYDKLYENYEENRNTILKQINKIESNIAQDHPQKQSGIKERAYWDKLTVEVQAKQKKLDQVIIDGVS